LKWNMSRKSINDWKIHSSKISQDCPFKLYRIPPTVIAPYVVFGGKSRQLYSKTLTRHNSLISKDIEVGQKRFLIVLIFTFWLFEVKIGLIMYFFMISNHPVFVDDIIFEKSQKVAKYLIDGVKILKTITGDFFLIILN